EYKIIDKTGKVTASIKDRIIGRVIFGPFVNGIALTYSSGTTNGTVYGYIDKTGKTIVPCKYREIGEFQNGYAKVLNGRYGMVDKTGKEIISTRYTSVFPFADGFIIAYGWDGNNWSFAFDKNGKEIIKGKGLDLSTFSNGLLRVNGRYIIDTTGKQVVKSGKYEKISDLNNGIAIVTAYTGKSGTKDSDKYRYGAIDKTGKEVLVPTLNYDRIDFFAEKMYKVERNGKYGLIKLSPLAETKSQTISVTIKGTAKVGKILTAKLTPSCTNISYQWYADSVAIKKATKATFKVTSAQAGKTITVKVTATIKGGKKGSAKSKGVKIIK
uniref:WG repeat-containing protein n=1 Tax=Anaerosporobacter sp. TaxID=1872529 RepID=UPI00286EBC6A